MLRQLHRVNKLRQLTPRTTDGDVGTPEEFYFDDSACSVRYLVGDTDSWLRGRRVPISPAAVAGNEDIAKR